MAPSSAAPRSLLVLFGLATLVALAMLGRLAARQPPTAKTLLLTMAAWLALSVYWPIDWPLDPRVLALVTLVPQAVTVAVAALALRQHAPQPAARSDAPQT